jgi:UDP-N-acetylmuramoylalanine--D-glutamate ligase
MTLFGYGDTTKAIAQLFKECIIYDDRFSDIEYDKYGNKLLPSSLFDPDTSKLEVTSPGIPPSNPLIKKSKNLISEYDLFYESMPYSIWVTGTNGKTTTTAMIEYLLQTKGAVAGGNIGTPLAKLDQKANIWILETSSFTLHYTNKAKPNLYVVLPISDDHTKWHGSFKEYEKAKLKPLENMLEGEIVILPKKYESIKTNAMKIPYSSASDLSRYFGIDINSIEFKEPFLTDALLALGVSKILYDEVNYKKINSFTIGKHKGEHFIDNRGRVWIDDSKATNIDATISALNGLKDKEVFLIVGGDDKGADLKPLFQSLKNSVKLFIIGSNSNKLTNLSKNYKINYTTCGTMQNAVQAISKEFISHTNQVAILSPAAASFDQFKSYKDRGEQFKKFVLNI